MRKIICLISVLFTIIFVGCSSVKSEEDNIVDVASNTYDEEVYETIDLDVNIVAMKGPTSIGMSKFIYDSKQELYDYNYNFQIVGSVDEVPPMLVQGKVDIASVPANLASVLYNNTSGDIEVLAINTLGVLYVIENGEAINSVEDLRGKTIYASGKGATPEYVLNYVLTQNGLNPETDINIKWKSEHAECLSALLADENGIAMLPQPFVTTSQMLNEEIRIALSLTEEWDKLQENIEDKSTLITGVVVGRKEFIEENPEAIKAFMEHYQYSVDYVNNNITEASEIVGSLNIVPTEVAKKAIPYCNIVFIKGVEMKELLSGYLNVLYQENPVAVGNSLPADDFYYMR